MTDAELTEGLAEVELRRLLAEAITKRKQAERTLATLIDAQAKAHLQLRHAESEAVNADADLRQAKASERSRLAYGFASNGGQLTDDPVARHAAIVTAADLEIAKLKKVENALAGEIDSLQSSLRTLTHNVWAAMANLVTASDEFALLVESQRAAFVRLRSVKLALAQVVSGLHGYCPHAHLDLPYLNEPVSDRRIGFAVDEELVGAWATAMTELVDDSSVDLPLFAG